MPLPRSSRPVLPLSVGARRRLPGSLALLLGLLAAAAQAAPFRLTSATVDAGGTHSQGARFSVEGTAGQPDAGRLQGARFTLEGGFWPTTEPTAPQGDALFQNSFED